MTDDVALSVRGLTVAYRETPVLRGVDLDVRSGIVMGVVGPNGAGKSTLLKVVLALLKPLAGSVRIFGEPFDRVRRRVGYVPQSASLDWDFPTTARDVVMMGTYGELGWLRRPRRAERERTIQAMASTGVADLADRQLGELSGGQRQRVLLARALVQEPDLFVMDEPFQGVDAHSQHAIVTILHELRRQGKTVLLVHHDLATVPDYCDEVTLLNRRVVASGPVEDAFTADAIRATYDVGADDSFLDRLR